MAVIYEDLIASKGRLLQYARRILRPYDGKTTAGLFGVVILVDYSGDDAFSADRSQVGHVPDRLRPHIRGPLPPGLVRPLAVVMGHVLAEHQSQVAFAGDQDPVRQLAAEGPIDALADGVAPHRQLHPIRAIGTSASG
jgi:hypothetical protein